MIDQSLQHKLLFMEDLTPIQRMLREAIEKGDTRQFTALQGNTSADLNFDISKEGAFPLMIVASTGDIDMLSLMLQNQTIDVNRKDRFGVNAFWIAAFNEHIDIMKKLAHAGIDIHCKNQNGSNAMHIAVKQNSIQVVQALVQMRFPLDRQKNNGVTAIGIAALKGLIKIVQMLADAGANINVTSKNGISPLYLAIKEGHMLCIQYLITRGAQLYYNDNVRVDNSPIFQAIRMNNLKVVEIICEAFGKSGFDQCLSSQRYTPLLYACSLNHFEIVNYLSLRQSNLNQFDYHGVTPLGTCLNQQHYDLADKLIKRGADINFRNQFGKTQLQMLIEAQNIDSIKWLLSHGANPHVEDPSGLDACDYAFQRQLQMFPQLNKCDHTQRVKYGKVQVNEKMFIIAQNTVDQRIQQLRDKIQHQPRILVTPPIEQVSPPPPRQQTPEVKYEYQATPKQTVKKQLIDSRSNLQEEKLPLFLREDFIYREKPTYEHKHSDKDMNPLAPISAKLTVKKQELLDLDRRLEQMEYENQINMVVNQNLIDNVQADLKRRSSHARELREKRDQERILKESGKNDVKKDVLTKLSSQGLDYVIYSQTGLGNNDIKTRLLKQEQSLNMLSRNSKAKLDTLMDNFKSAGAPRSSRVEIGSLRSYHGIVQDPYSDREQKLKMERQESRDRQAKYFLNITLNTESKLEALRKQLESDLQQYKIKQNIVTARNYLSERNTIYK
ncbi:hypothetical protein FGO68_gene1920 [Halteria grandinella]|uniref:Ankyrin repeat domain-containing protein n=1 Tax=Halteria grandinella TaxID=5974 RepID=A0A8J8NXJ0_HALGN|nr:hypothetical protein FGO68_gene1920 [Halteria grandinella]